MMDAKKVDVLAVLDELISFEERHAEYEPRANHEAREARDAVVELIRVSERASSMAMVLGMQLQRLIGDRSPGLVSKADQIMREIESALSRIGAPA